MTYLLKYVLLDRDDFEKPRAIADFHLSIRYAQARRMAAPAVAVAPAEAAVMAGPGRRADLAWARRTLLPAAQRLAARIGGPVFLGGVWRDDPEQPLELRFRFGGPKTVWREQAMRKAHAHEHAWLATAGRAERLNRPRVTPLYEG